MVLFWGGGGVVFRGRDFGVAGWGWVGGWVCVVGGLRVIYFLKGVLGGGFVCVGSYSTVDRFLRRGGRGLRVFLAVFGEFCWILVFFWGGVAGLVWSGFLVGV